MTGQATSAGKVILLGEHAVVYGHPALVSGLPDGARASASPHDHACLCLAGEEYPSGHGEVGTALEALLRVLGSPRLRIDAELLLPAGLGLGASAALGVAIAGAVLDAGRFLPAPVARLEQITSAAQAWETVFHGTPSGIDVTAAARGGCFRFTRGQEPVPLVVKQPLSLAIAVVGPNVRTKVMVAALARLYEREPARVKPALEQIRVLVDAAHRAIEQGDREGLGQAMDDNQALLETLQLSTKPLETACQIARDHGALGAKLTGKGGGGCVVALCQSDPHEVLSAWRARALECFATTIPAHPGLSTKAVQR